MVFRNCIGDVDVSKFFGVALGDVAALAMAGNAVASAMAGSTAGAGNVGAPEMVLMALTMSACVSVKAS